MYRCVNTDIDPDGSEPYNDLNEFLDMCWQIFDGWVPEVSEVNGMWIENDTGYVLLVPVH